MRCPGAGNRFPPISLLQSAKLWQKSYFYVKNIHPTRDYINLSAYVDGPPAEPRANWQYKPSSLLAACSVALARLQVMTELEGLKGSDLLAAYVPRRTDPLADLREATERNAREAHEELEKVDAAKAEADAAAKAQADAAAKEQVDAAAKAQEMEAARSRAPRLVVPLRAVQPAPGSQAPTGGAGDDQPVQERGGGDPIVLGAEVPPPTPTADAQTSRPIMPQVPPVGGAAADLQQRLGEAQTELRTKEEERRKAVEECDRLANELAAQADQHKAALKNAKDDKAALQAEFETECSGWAEKEKALSDGYGEIEDMIDEIAPNAARALSDQLLAIHARLQPSHQMLRRLQRVRARVLTTLWPDSLIPRTPSRTAEWLEVAVGRFEAWKGSAARPGARRALEFVKAWYPGLHLAQLATFRLEAAPELAAASLDQTHRAAAIADYADTFMFVSELNEEGAEVPPNWFGMNPEYEEDSVEEIASSDEGEDEGDEDGEDDASGDGADGQPQPDQASTNEPRVGEPTAAGADQAETNQTSIPPPGASTSADPSDPTAAPPA
nr:uncharacterized abhydrolase domain-containing protein DDB_G0269086-like [Aegilops tauschii subsp. strangulata]